MNSEYVQGDKNVSRSRGAREARAIWKLVNEHILESHITPTLSIETTIKKAQNFSPAGCILIFFAENGTTAVSGVGAVNFGAALKALMGLTKYVQE